jgi:hypothetical protein
MPLASNEVPITPHRVIWEFMNTVKPMPSSRTTPAARANR